MEAAEEMLVQAGKYMKYDTATISLDEPVGDEEGSFMMDFVEDEKTERPEVFAEKVILKEEIDKIVKELPEREQYVIYARFGFADEAPKTLEEIGAELSVTRERVRQIEAKALQKIRIRACRKRLHEFMS